MTLFHLWNLPGAVLAAPESASGLDRCNLSLSLSLLPTDGVVSTLSSSGPQINDGLPSSTSDVHNHLQLRLCTAWRACHNQIRIGASASLGYLDVTE